jgi:hypothetical protein
VANCYFVLVSDLVTMGLGVVISCSIGLSIGMLIANRGYTRRNRSEMMTIWMISSLFILILIATSNHILIHFFGLLIGILYGCAWIPQLQPTGFESILSSISKILSIGLTALPIVLIFLHPLGTTNQ